MNDADREEFESTCPRCGEPYDNRRDQIIECPRCLIEGSTNCCNPGGRRVLCIECNSKDEEDEDNDG